MIEPILYLKRHLTSFQIMILGFAGVILLGGAGADAAYRHSTAGLDAVS